MSEAIQPVGQRREHLLQTLSPEARRLLTGAAAGAILAGVGAAFLAVPDVVPPPAVSPRVVSHVAAPTVSNPTLKVTVTPVLRTPFTAGHESRLEMALPPAEVVPEKTVPEKRLGPPPRMAPRPRLTGIVSANHQTMALIDRGGQTMALAPGESRGGVTLVEIRGERARVRDENGEYELCLPGREEATGQ